MIFSNIFVLNSIINYISWLICLFFLGLDKIEFLQSHENLEIYQKAFEIIEHYFGGEEEDSKVAPTVDESGAQFKFPEAGAPPQGGFNF